jgi:hypothetical protein
MVPDIRTRLIRSTARIATIPRESPMARPESVSLLFPADVVVEFDSIRVDGVASEG